MTTGQAPCDRIDEVYAYALDSVAPAEAARVEAHLAECKACRSELERLRPVVAQFDAWTIETLRPSSTLWDRLAVKIAGGPSATVPSRWREPDWAEVAPGIHCKMLAADPRTERVTLLVRLDPGVDYPPHTHAGLEELHLLEGELWIDDRKLYTGDYNRAEAGTADARVWSETGCMCVLITSGADILR